MKRIIVKDGIKRELHSPFELCMSRKDMEMLLENLKEILRDDRFSYGWRQITELHTDHPGNTYVIQWDDK
jgi:hypothetical protein